MNLQILSLVSLHFKDPALYANLEFYRENYPEEYAKAKAERKRKVNMENNGMYALIFSPKGAELGGKEFKENNGFHEWLKNHVEAGNVVIVAEDEVILRQTIADMVLPF